MNLKIGNLKMKLQPRVLQIAILVVFLASSIFVARCSLMKHPGTNNVVQFPVRPEKNETKYDMEITTDSTSYVLQSGAKIQITVNSFNSAQGDSVFTEEMFLEAHIKWGMEPWETFARKQFFLQGARGRTPPLEKPVRLPLSLEFSIKEAFMDPLQNIVLPGKYDMWLETRSKKGDFRSAPIKIELKPGPTVLRKKEYELEVCLDATIYEIVPGAAIQATVKTFMPDEDEGAVALTRKMLSEAYISWHRTDKNRSVKDRESSSGVRRIRNDMNLDIEDVRTPVDLRFLISEQFYDMPRLREPFDPLKTNRPHYFLQQVVHPGSYEITVLIPTDTHVYHSAPVRIELTNQPEQHASKLRYDMEIAADPAAYILQPGAELCLNLKSFTPAWQGAILTQEMIEQAFIDWRMAAVDQKPARQFFGDRVSWLKPPMEKLRVELPTMFKLPIKREFMCDERGQVVPGHYKVNLVIPNGEKFYPLGNGFYRSAPIDIELKPGPVVLQKTYELEIATDAVSYEIVPYAKINVTVNAFHPDEKDAPLTHMMINCGMIEWKWTNPVQRQLKCPPDDN